MSEATALLALQDVDLQLMRLKSELDSMPQQAKLRAIRAANKKLSGELSKIVGQRKDAQIDIDDLESQLLHYEEKADEVRALAQERAENYRQVQDLEAQLTHLAKRIEKTNFELVAVRERLAKAQLAERNARSMADRLADEEKAQTASYEHDTAEMKREVVGLLARREELASQVPQELLGRYDKARARFKGLAVERLVGNVPSTCRVKLQPAVFGDLRRGPLIAECPYCHRILITEENPEE